MLKNVPKYEEMTELAVQAYFVAWKEATALFKSIEETGLISFEIKDEKLVPCAGYENSPTQEDSIENLARYEALMQGKLRLVYSLVQHSQELALKSHICRESPYLLLSGVDPKKWAKDADFTDLQTIDAIDLLRVVATVTDLKISADFQRRIDDVRRGRNSIQHLGRHENIDLLEPIRILSRQYNELLPGRSWLKDLDKYEDDGLEELFHYSGTTRMYVLYELSMLHRLLSKKGAKKLLGMDKDASAYECQDCIQSSNFDHQGYSVESIERKRGSLTGRCLLCERTFTLVKVACGECGCDVAFEDGEGAGRCCECNSQVLGEEGA